MADKAHFNRAQLRTQTMKEELKNVEPTHLDMFLSGIANREPPIYQIIDGKVQPPLATVIIKEDANRYDFGNVSLCEEAGGGVHHVWVTIENGHAEAHVKEPLPRDPGDLLTAVILDSVFVHLFELWKQKYEAIQLHARQVNEARSVAHHAANMQREIFPYGETIMKLQQAQRKTDGHSSDDANNKKREGPGDVIKHPANKRKKIGIASIPDSVKNAAFDKIPEGTKAELFNAVAKIAFPDIDPVLTAAWNVVSVFQSIGTEFPALHTTIMDLHRVLLEMESKYTKVKIEQSPAPEGNQASPGESSDTQQSNQDDQHNNQVGGYVAPAHPYMQQGKEKETATLGRQAQVGDLRQEYMQGQASSMSEGLPAEGGSQPSGRAQHQFRSTPYTVRSGTSEMRPIASLASELHKSVQQTYFGHTTSQHLPSDESMSSTKPTTQKNRATKITGSGAASRDTPIPRDEDMKELLKSQLKQIHGEIREVQGQPFDSDSSNGNESPFRRPEIPRGRDRDSRGDSRSQWARRSGSRFGGYDGSYASRMSSPAEGQSEHGRNHNRDGSAGVFLPDRRVQTGNRADDEELFVATSNSPSTGQMQSRQDVPSLGNSKLGPKKGTQADK
ncbi:hypothetical protein BU24DRAFT_494659 [Aaosphaeria arxii CBS 175.79]|uniref:Uncharacterized protein n=1 Tax=Aaosphaeria arxii CBS 175.79 TaxID=1450172 RepID=A0A6A5XIP0_9PLEO|nr:uncharacterized protein BU24DRAFT_494659 [Aaosphaeria arxii CBS 175.79]KAF2012701.1 hypothetical protein BU24DRAFT_494659 [Aaosphaeria arxii CBS 175.79]